MVNWEHRAGVTSGWGQVLNFSVLKKIVIIYEKKTKCPFFSIHFLKRFAFNSKIKKRFDISCKNQGNSQKYFSVFL